MRRWAPGSDSRSGGRLARCHRSLHLLLRRSDAAILVGKQLIEPPAIRVPHNRRWDQLAILEVLVAPPLPPTVARDHLLRAEEYVPRVKSRVEHDAGLADRAHRATEPIV